MTYMGRTQRKILLAISNYDSTFLSFFSLHDIYGKLLNQDKYFEKIRIDAFKRSFEYLAKKNLVSKKRCKDGSFKLVFTKSGKDAADKMFIMSNSIKFNNKKEWDKKWRIVMFDIPEKLRNFRNVFRDFLKEAGFENLQQSVFVSPHPYEEKIMKLVDLYAASDYVRVITATNIDNKKELKNIFFKK